MMIKINSLLIVLYLFPITVCATSQTEQYEELRAAVKAQCDIPDHLVTYSANAYSRYLAQVFIPELKMLNTAFFNGFTITDSKNMGRGACVIVFMGKPNDSVWEKRSNFYEKAQNYNTLPVLVYDGFSEEGRLKLKPLGNPVN